MAFLILFEPDYTYKTERSGACSAMELKEKNITAFCCGENRYGIVIDQESGTISSEGAAELTSAVSFSRQDCIWKYKIMDHTVYRRLYQPSRSRWMNGWQNA